MFILVICVFREQHFRNNGWTRSKVEKREQGLQLGNPRVNPPGRTFRPKHRICPIAHTKNSWPAKERSQLRLGQIWVSFGRGFAFKFNPKLSNTTVNLFSPYDLRDKPNQRIRRMHFSVTIWIRMRQTLPLASLRETFGKWQNLTCGHPSGEFGLERKLSSSVVFE